MYFQSVDEEKAVHFTKELLDSYKKIDDGVQDTILTHRDEESQRNNVGWYQHIDDQHKIFMNIPNILCARFGIQNGAIDYDGFYAFLTLCTGHEFRHFLQGRVIYDGQEIDGYTQDDVFHSELMLFIRYFFDAYYLSNKGNIKYEVDAEKFSIINGIQYLKEYFPGIPAEKSMLDAVNFYAEIQTRGGGISTLPLGCHTIEEAIQKLQENIQKNERIPEVDRTLFVYHPRFYQTHMRFGLDENQVLTRKFIEEYRREKDGSKRDLLVVNRILSLLEHPEKSLEEFPQLKKRYQNHTL